MAVTVNELGKVRYNVRGEYTTSESYYVDDIVTYVGGTYKANANNSSGAHIPGISGNWTKLSGLTRERGRWSSSTQYQVNDIVSYIHEYAYNAVWKYYDVSTYICKQANSGYNPTNSAYSTQWHRLSTGSCHKRYAFLGACNEGFVPPYKPLWNARSQSKIGTINTLRLSTSGSGWLTTNKVNGKTGSPKTGMLRLTASGGGGSGFEGVAHINSSGQIFQCEIVNPGEGYTSSPTINIDNSVSGYTGRSGGSNPSFSTYVTTNSSAGATGTNVLVCMGDSIGPSKTYGSHNTQYNYRYINRRYMFVSQGVNEYRSGCVSTSGDGNSNNFSEGNFVNLDYIDGLLPTPDGEYPKIIQVESGGRNTLVLFNNGEVHYCGYNGHGQSGSNWTGTMECPLRCGYANVNKSGTTALRGKKAIRIASTDGGNDDQSCANYALIEETNGDRSIYSWGYNGYGQLGHNDTSNRDTPTQISLNASVYGRVVEIWASGGQYGYMMALTDKGHLYCCGYNGYGQCGSGNTSQQRSLSGNRVNANSFGTLTGTNQRVKKFSINGSGSHGFNALVRGDGSAYTWGYNGYGNLGHNHTYNTYVPIRVRTSGYSGASNPVTSTGNQGSGQGTAFTDCVDYWTCGGDSHVFSYMTRGSSITNNTLYACGYNGYYNLSNSSNNTSNQNTFQNVKINNNSNATNVMMVCSNQGHSSSHISVAIYRYNSTFAARPYGNRGEWYFGGYDAGVSGRCHSDSYENRRDLDPDYVNNNYRLKNNYFEPYANYGNWFMNQTGRSSAKAAYFVDLRTGEIFGTQNSPFGNSGGIGSIGDGTGMGSMRRPRHTHQ